MSKGSMRALSGFLSLCLLGGLAACGRREEEESPKTKSEYETVAFMDGYQPAIDIEPYREALEADSKDYLLLANKQHPLGSTHVPESLADIEPSLTLGGKALQLDATAAAAASALIHELHARGYTDILMTSAYRTYARQDELYSGYINDELSKHPDWSRAQAETQVLTYSAKPGTSEHQTGLCMDLISARDCVLDESFAQHPAYAWLVENAHCFGFILRYPNGLESVTGYSYEPWHYRFVGVQAATTIHNLGLTLEQYLRE